MARALQGPQHQAKTLENTKTNQSTGVQVS